jgi:hypothetical protein
MFKGCYVYINVNGFVSSFNFEEILKQVQDDGLKKGKGKNKY